jgi:E3 ubiquitin-protein ligase RNF144
MITRSFLRKNKNKPKQFYCGVCMNDCPVESKIFLENCSKRHSFCFNCTKSYASAMIQDGATDIKCPESQCNVLATDKDIRLFVSPIETKKLRVSKLKLDPTYRECDSCGEQMMFEGRTKMTCNCGVSSCYLHGQLHPNETCAEFVYRTEHAGACAEVIQRTTKKCPKCSADTEKDGGCDHMVSSAIYMLDLTDCFISLAELLPLQVLLVVVVQSGVSLRARSCGIRHWWWTGADRLRCYSGLNGLK